MGIGNKKVNDNNKNDAKDKTLLSRGKKILKGAFVMTTAAVGVGIAKETFFKDKEFDVDSTEDGFSVGFTDKEEAESVSVNADTSVATKDVRAEKNAKVRNDFSVKVVDIDTETESDTDASTGLDY